MIAGQFHTGSGLGNQLHRYVMTRVLALDRGYEWGMLGKSDFKGKDFFHWFDYGSLIPADMWKTFKENCHVGYNDLSSIEDGMIIDGEFQGEDYWKHRRKEINEWLKVETLDMPDGLCVINFRGGEYVGFSELFLNKRYWQSGIRAMTNKNPDMRFVVHTDDIATARAFFPDYPCVHDIGLNWRSIRYAKHLILSNSSFAILPAWLNQDADILAPRYWARPYGRKWVLPYNRYKGWKYITCFQ